MEASSLDPPTNIRSIDTDNRNRANFIDPNVTETPT